MEATMQRPMSAQRYLEHVYPKSRNQQFLQLHAMAERVRDLVARNDFNAYKRSIDDHDYVDIATSAELAGKVFCPIDGVAWAVPGADPRAISIAITPRSGLLIAPCNSRVTGQIPSKNMIGLLTAEGGELLITVGKAPHLYRGSAFRQLVWQNDTIAGGTPMIAWDRSKLQREGYDDTVIVTLTNPQEFMGVRPCAAGRMSRGDLLMQLGCE